MKIFLDTAVIDEIRKLNHLIDGVTTNPSLIAKEKHDLSSCIKEICAIVSGPISVEVVSERSNEMITEAIEYAKIAPNIIIKIPITEEGLIALPELHKRDIRTNVTLVFSVNQALLAAKSGATYVSIFIGRLDDLGYDGMGVIRDSVKIYKNYNFATELIAASIRHPLHIVECALSGCHVSTIPPEILRKMISNPLTTNGLEKFMQDYQNRVL